VLDNIVRAVEPPAVREAISEHDDRAVMLGAGDPAIALLAADEATLTVDGMTVGVPRVVPEYAHYSRRFVPAHHPVIRDIAEHEVATGGEVGGTLDPAAPGEDPLGACVTPTTAETLVNDLELGLDAVGHR